MTLSDRIFERLFARVFVYNILWEDSEVDDAHLELSEDSTLLGISGAGCRIAGHVSQHPRRIDAVDINPHHLALAALKAASAQRVRAYDEFYALLGRGAHPEHAALIRWITGALPAWIQGHWQRRSHQFARGFYRQGLTARMFMVLRRLTGIDAAWLRERCAESVPEREAAIDRTVAPMLRRPLVAAWLRSPVNLLALGINFAQRDRLARAHGEGLAEHFITHLKRVAATDLARNWFAWTAIAGEYNHDDPAAVPPYLRRERHARSYGSPTRLRFHHRNIFDVLADAGPWTWSHYTLCDAPDWMTPAQQRRLFAEVLRTSRDGGVLAYRSVEPVSLVQRLGLDRRLRPLTEASADATRRDRSRQYESINYYRICH